MKRLFALVLASMLVCSTFLISTSAVTIYYSPERPEQGEIIPDPPTPEDPTPVEPTPDDPTPEDPTPVEPPVDIEDEDVPQAPTSPQTGYEMGIGGLVSVAVLAGAVAVVSSKKAFGR